MAHDFKRFPELTNNQLSIYYWESPHRQITEDFVAEVVKVHDGDTITVRWDERDFDFPIRFANLAAPEMNQPGGKESQKWLESQILGEEVEINITKSRVEKWGRLLGDIIFRGMSMSNMSIATGHGIRWDERKKPDFIKQLEAFE